MWRITKDPMYRECEWTIFRALQEHTLLFGGEGFTALQDVRQIPPPRRDNMESFWLVSLASRAFVSRARQNPSGP
jgi:mannosyl-oligosaccharide alpha-1,2-mannosidase